MTASLPSSGPAVSTPQKMDRRVVLALAYLLLSFYTFGGAIVESFVYYPAWKLVGAAEFAAFHRDMSGRLLPVFVAPYFLSILLNALMIRVHPPLLPVRLIVASLALNLLIFAATVGWAIPIQMQLSQGLSQEAIVRLIAIDRPFRMVPGILMEIINVAMLFRLVSPERRDAETAQGNGT